ncbi:MAG: ribulose-phosphate 3-epimerase [Acidobacteria bacterium RIFCSPLOWO2_02_FULL_59_13]|nr:MAG: ribulose-phosphate 3-epimerase [Acidobacteria bacterium RIFCSPLOWO2_02_FULL_59_13]
MIKIAPSILSADFSRLGEEVKSVEKAGADMIHVDVMDGHFVPNLTIGPLVVEAVRRVTALPLDVHLMMLNPDDFIEDFVRAGSSWITVHVEVCHHLQRTLQRIKDLGVKAGVALNPATPFTSLDCILDEADLVLVMSVNPGFGGQSFLSGVLPKIEHLRRELDRRKSKTEIEVDGGIHPDTALQVRRAGASILVAGSAIFHGRDYRQTINLLRGNSGPRKTRKR